MTVISGYVIQIISLSELESITGQVVYDPNPKFLFKVHPRPHPNPTKKMHQPETRTESERK